jgi:tetratricopeptide (TPR) repeat protein
VLITTRERGWTEVAAPVEVDVLTRAESVAIMQDRVAGLTSADADRLAAELGDLPLAIAQAAGFMSETGMVADQYLNLLRTRAGQLLDQGAPGSYPRSLAAATRLIADRLGDEDPAAAELASLCAFLAPEPIPIELFTGAASILPGDLAARVADPLDWRQTLAHLASQSLARIDHRGLQMHRLTQAILRDWLSPGQAAATLHPLVRATNAAQPDVRDDPRGYLALATELVWALAGEPDTETDEDPRMWSRWRVLAPHAFHLLRQIGFIGELAGTQTASQACRAAMLAARYLFALGLYEQAQTELLEVLDTARRLLGPEHPDSLAARHQFARVLDKRGKHEQAEIHLTDALQARRRVLGDNHPGTLATRNQRAWTLHAQGQDNEAESELLTVLETRLRVLGDEHPDTLVTRMDLAEVWHAQGRQQQAETEYRTVLEARRRILGEDHPKALNTRADLARLWHEQGRLEDAEAGYRAIITARCRILGENHPNTLTSRHDLASVLSQQGRRQQARAEYRAVLDARRRVLGEDHPDTLATAAALAAMDRDAP